MKCPVCPAPTELLMTVREGIEIDYCPTCRGVWLDRGELDQIIKRDAQIIHEAQTVAREEWRGDERDRDHRPRQRHDGHHDHNYGDSRMRRDYPRKKKSFLGDLFDFD